MQAGPDPLPLALRRVTRADAALLLTWRNDPLTRALSHDVGNITGEGHDKWLAASLTNPGRRLYMAELEGSPVGTVRADLDIADGSWQLSWTIAPQVRGRGLGQRMVALLADEITAPITAEVKSANAASARIAQLCGMTLQETVGGVLRFRRPARPRGEQS